MVPVSVETLNQNLAVSRVHNRDRTLVHRIQEVWNLHVKLKRL